ncbi:protein O-mannosyl-transferase TMTC1-like [Chrysoperla carnea]|uniref:protein O-mannosyl-transferase TMTC1-like n=1 Tax=Chrysoperla carnea TaxID=189513 RepID=UPI001D085008|nr:protein O-mannosyl-transferase TMTC1-like [Chrysoperla carnea]
MKELANYLCFGLRPIWWHATNVLLHVICCILFTRVCLLIARMRPGFAALAGLLFAAHPIHTEAVTGIVGRADVLACVFFLISLLAYHGHIDGKCQIWASVALGGLSMLAKETGITVFVLNLAYDMYRCWPFIKRTFVEVRWNEETCQLARRASKILMSLGVLLAVRLAILQGSLPKFSQQDNPTAFHPSLYVRLITFCYLAAFNWWLLLCPVTLSHDWQMGSIPLVTSYSDYRNIITCLFFGCALVLAYRCLMDFEQQRHIPLVLGVLLLILPFLPATNLFVTVGFVVAERVLYIPSMGGIMLTVYGMQLLWSSFIKHRQTLLCFAILLLAAGCLRTIARNRDWRSRESLLRSGLQTLPHNAKMHYNFANFLRDSRKTELAMAHYQKALQLWPTYASAHNNLGTLITNKFQAEKHFLLAIRFSSDHVNAHYNLGQLYRKSNRTSDSARMLEKCIALEPTYTPAYLELARLRGMNDLRSGQLLKHVVQLHPKNANHLTLYGDWLRGQGRNFESLKYYWRALQISGTHKGAVTGTCRVLRTLGQRSRLLQLIARWQLIERSKRGEPLPFIGLHLYLRSYQLHAELSNKAKEYDNSCSCKICTNKCQQPKTQINMPIVTQPESQSFNNNEPSSVGFDTPTKRSSTTPSVVGVGSSTAILTCNRTQRGSGSTASATSVANSIQRSTSCSSQTTRLCRLSRNRWLQKSKLSTDLLLHHLLDSL